MSRVAVLGMGLMGSRMAVNLLGAGHTVAVWNRTPSRIKPLVTAGARAAVTPRDAVRDAEFIISMVRDDDASRTVWLDPENGALAGINCKTVALESSTLSIAWARALAAHCQKAGVDFLDAPVLGSLPQADSAELVYFIGGDRSVLERTTALLNTLGKAIHYIGPHGSGAALKLAANALLAVQVSTSAELIGMLTHVNIDVRAAIEALSATPVCSVVVKNASTAMLGHNFAPLFPINLVEKDLGYVLLAAGTSDRVPLARAAHRVFRSAISLGYGDENLTGVVQLYRAASSLSNPSGEKS